MAKYKKKTTFLKIYCAQDQCDQVAQFLAVWATFESKFWAKRVTSQNLRRFTFVQKVFDFMKCITLSAVFATIGRLFTQDFRSHCARVDRLVIVSHRSGVNQTKLVQKN